ncbi:6779_t:CDS:10 [Entrophospora sp. SA101]|nr:24528_t:CDS:10 [Entrophospora sp. SA101]CAJ0762465.1 6779_t:CDS:10 [Entrophospora sp. SA101]
MDRSNRSPTSEQEQPHSNTPAFQKQRTSVGQQHPMQPQLHMAPPFRPLLPSGWTEHCAPNGLLYYYNATTGQSTWERPIMAPPPPPTMGSPPGLLQPPGFQPMGGMHPMSLQQQQQLHMSLYPSQQNRPKEKKKKEKSKGKKQILDTKWYIVNTTESNEFYYNSETKQSVWEIPEEIADAVKALKEQEAKESQNNNKLNNEGVGVKRKADDDEESVDGEDVKRAKGRIDEDISFQLQFMEEQELLAGGVKLDEHSDLQKYEMTGGGIDNSQKSFKEQNREVELSPEERVLMDMDVSPFAMWEKELPRIIHDSRYTLIPTLKQRKEYFDEYCKERAVEVRAEKKNKALHMSAKDEYSKLLEEETTHRSHWDEFRRMFKKDLRFKNFSDDKEREKLFRNHVDDLKEKEFQPQQKRAEEEFTMLLMETREIKYDSSWRKIKRLINDDPRYDEVQSSIRREELFQASLRQRELQVRKEKKAQERNKDGAKRQAIHEESILAFRTLLIDLVRTHETTWETKKTDLERDSRYHSERLNDGDREQLFNEHLNQLYQKNLKAYHQLLDKHVNLDTTWLEISHIIKDDPRSSRLSKSDTVLEELFDKYLERRILKAKEEFRELLQENKLVEYRTRLVKLSEDGAADETGTMKEKARGLTLEEINDLLKDDKRYLVLNHIPEVRDETILEFLNKLEAPKMTVHQGRE